MGDHRISLKIQFSMHGHDATLDQWRSYFEGYPDEVRDWLEEQITIGMGKYWDAEFDAETLREAEREKTERDELARLKSKYEKPPP